LEHLVGKTDAGKDLRNLSLVAPARPGKSSQIGPGRIPVETAHIDVVEHAQRPHQSRGLGYQRGPISVTRVEKTEQGRFADTGATQHGNPLAGCDGDV